MESYSHQTRVKSDFVGNCLKMLDSAKKAQSAKMDIWSQTLGSETPFDGFAFGFNLVEGENSDALQFMTVISGVSTLTPRLEKAYLKSSLGYKSIFSLVPVRLSAKRMNAFTSWLDDILKEPSLNRSSESVIRGVISELPMSASGTTNPTRKDISIWKCAFVGCLGRYCDLSVAIGRSTVSKEISEETLRKFKALDNGKLSNLLASYEDNSRVRVISLQEVDFLKQAKLVESTIFDPFFTLDEAIQFYAEYPECEAAFAFGDIGYCRNEEWALTAISQTFAIPSRVVRNQTHIVLLKKEADGEWVFSQQIKA